MPAEDRYHPAVIHALVKEGWTITGEQIKVTVDERRLWIDIRAEKAAERLAILVEVKGFENTPSPVEYLASAVGKYLMYKTALDFAQIDLPLYMAVPEAAYSGILSEAIGREMIEAAQIVFDPETEVILQWHH